MHHLQILYFDEVYDVFFNEDGKITELFCKPPGLSSFPSLVSIYTIPPHLRQRIEEAVANEKKNE